VRIRIALTTAIAVIAGMITGIFTLSASHPAASASADSHHPTHTTTLAGTALTGFSIPSKVPVVPTTTTTTATAPTTKVATFALPVLSPAVAHAQAAVVAPTTTTTTTTTPPPPPPVTDADSVATADWSCIRVHESGDQYNNPADPSGAYGILISTWREFGYSGWPYQAPASVQDQLALKLYSLYGFHPWSSRFACGL
jgi:Transglycosylase-like domain